MITTMTHCFERLLQTSFHFVLATRYAFGLPLSQVVLHSLLSSKITLIVFRISTPLLLCYLIFLWSFSC